MEPVDRTLIRYCFFTKIIAISKRQGTYFMHLEGSHESVNLGPELPMFKVGDAIKVTFERTEDVNETTPIKSSP